MPSPKRTFEGTGPLHERTPAGEAAAAEEVTIPGHDDGDAEKHPTGEDQADENRENDPPA